MSTSNKPREITLVEQPHVVSAIEEAYATYPRFHDLYDGITWRLCRDPIPEEAVQIVPDTYVLKSEAWEYAGFCTITLLYTVSDAGVSIEDLKVEPIAPTNAV